MPGTARAHRPSTSLGAGADEPAPRPAAPSASGAAPPPVDRERVAQPGAAVRAPDERASRSSCPPSSSVACAPIGVWQSASRPRTTLALGAQAGVGRRVVERRRRRRARRRRRRARRAASAPCPAHGTSSGSVPVASSSRPRRSRPASGEHDRVEVARVQARQARVDVAAQLAHLEIVAQRAQLRARGAATRCRRGRPAGSASSDGGAAERVHRGRAGRHGGDHEAVGAGAPGRPWPSGRRGRRRRAAAPRRARGPSAPCRAPRGRGRRSS